MPKIHFLPMDVTVEVEPGTTVLEACEEHGIHLEHACEGSLACSTCHVIVRKGFNDLEPASDEEEDMLDQAWGLTPTSRLGCQVVAYDDLEVDIPSQTRNIDADALRAKLREKGIKR